ncbi:MAG TPA: response regulator [Patescibacteria group bacterium]|nr:response regulator [Patescibacteria group bacterium]
MDPNTTPETPTNGKKVLIIEDEQFISELYIRALTKAGYEVKVIIDGEAALKEAQSNTYDIILLDIMLPNMTGTEILRRLRDMQQTPNLRAKIIITTNLELAEEGRAAIEAQADGYIVKAEVTPKELAIFLDQLQINAQS